MQYKVSFSMSTLSDHPHLVCASFMDYIWTGERYILTGD